MKVLIAIPALDFCATDFTMSLAAMLAHRAHDKKLRKDIDIALFCSKGSLIAHSRNLCVAEAQRIGASHILFLDSDMTFPPDTLSRLAGHHKPIVGADYVRRVPPYERLGQPSWAGLIPQLKLMTSLPFGCILIKLTVFDEMDLPYFKYVEGATSQETLSEDTYWCNMAFANGHAIWCDAHVSANVGHVGTFVFRPGATPQ